MSRKEEGKPGDSGVPEATRRGCFKSTGDSELCERVNGRGEQVAGEGRMEKMG